MRAKAETREVAEIISQLSLKRQKQAYFVLCFLSWAEGDNPAGVNFLAILSGAFWYAKMQGLAIVWFMAAARNYKGLPEL
jgi:hypothetical protein